MLINNSVDIVARNMTINCERWKEISFSAEYYRSGQKSLVPLSSDVTERGRPAQGHQDLHADRFDQLHKLRAKFPKIDVVTADTDGGCLALFQRARSSASAATTPCWPATPRRTRTRG